ncbi:hypothetical protein N7539_006604 [Penicillium diatomitis]|uniref:Cep57 centrosome microtubule-binding domain-containing protein n=1 Tax=Penicillium diatomitis TaxID=2819901 RepID=A0A9X0BS38_9EURO|nr:uncharacterized protein N7539_006604 [Penicillium diatomitis]KAJ5480710.1 hypothetical protein N7539_006604 [Penicillium diatomitis]
MPLSDLDFTVSDFDPEHEALASTREFGSPRLPNMRQTYDEDIEKDEPDFVINTSTLERAFPEFSQLPTSEEEDNQAQQPNNRDRDTMSDISELSMEFGRGNSKNPARRIDDSRDSIMSFQNSVRSSSPAVRVEYPTPQKQSPARPTARRATGENLRKDAQLRRATQAQKEIANPPVLSKSQRDNQRRTFSDMHAKVRDNYDGSFIGDERPAPVATNNRSTRFGNLNDSQEIADAVERASREAYAKEMRKAANGDTPRKPSNNHNNTMGDTMTRQSFLLPDLPNISELVSGVYEDGTPVFPRQHKMRSTRFVSPPHEATDMSTVRGHRPLDAIPIPEDEKALFVSLRLLQDKVAELEMFKSDAERRIEIYREENALLKSGRARHSDNRGADEVDNKKQTKRLNLEIEKLEAENIALQNQLDIADRKSQVQEAAVKRLNHERESAISQLGVAYLETRELKMENDQLREENSTLKSQLNRIVSKHHRDEIQDTESSVSASDPEDSNTYSADVSRNTKDVTSKSARAQSKSKRQEESRSKVSTQVDKEISRLEKERAEEALFSIEKPTSKRASASKSSKSGPSESRSHRKQSNTSKQRVKRVILEDVSSALDSTEQTKESAEADDLTLLSVIDENEIAKLRRTLEEERLSRKQRRSSATKDAAATDTVNASRQSILKAPQPRKSALREPRLSISRPASAAGDITTRSSATMDADTSLVVPTSDRARRHSDQSAAPTPQRRKRRNVEDMTSAFILPDITLSRADLAGRSSSQLPESTQRALNKIAQHDGDNCMICKSTHPDDGSCSQEAVKIPQPIPVSERMPATEDPTMRPSQHPAVALATVLKTLEDELAHLKMQLASYQAAYNKLDVSLGKRQRKSIMQKIENVMKDIDMKSDQIYSLYDVLETCKGDLSKRDLDMTLESIGIDVTANTSKSRTGGVNVEDEEEDDLPWEGIESTAELTGRA